MFKLISRLKRIRCNMSFDVAESHSSSLYWMFLAHEPYNWFMLSGYTRSIMSLIKVFLTMFVCASTFAPVTRTT